jgi:cation transport regulator ChaB
MQHNFIPYTNVLKRNQKKDLFFCLFTEAKQHEVDKEDRRSNTQLVSSESTSAFDDRKQRT